MKKTDLYKNLGLATANSMKNAVKAAKPGAKDQSLKKKELASSNPLLKSLMGKAKSQ
jgi:hypothetical protein